MENKRHDDFIKAINTIQTHWYTMISKFEKIGLEKKINKLRRTVIVLSILVIILFVLVLID